MLTCTAVQSQKGYSSSKKLLRFDFTYLYQAYLYVNIFYYLQVSEIIVHLKKYIVSVVMVVANNFPGLYAWSLMLRIIYICLNIKIVGLQLNKVEMICGI